MRRTHIEGMSELEAQFRNLGKNFPKGQVRKAANKGCNLPLRKARSLAPKESGALKKGIIKVEEKKWKLNKKLKKAVFQVYFDRAKNSIFQKHITPEGRGTRGADPPKPTGYYPVSMEYGFKVHISGKRVEGKYFIKKAIEQTQNETIKTVVDSLRESIDKIIARG
jgi:hypothetical protein